MDASRRKAVKGSILTEIDGIGESKAKALLNHFGTLKAIKSASVDDLVKVKGINEQIASNIAKFFTEQEK
jgi:excinuclease ABC subunit C